MVLTIIVVLAYCFGHLIGYVHGWKKATDPECFTPQAPEKIFKGQK